MALEFKKLSIKREDNIVVINNSLEMEITHGDNIIVLEDDYVSSYDCRVCSGLGKIKIDCQKCSGRGLNRFETSCTDCTGLGYLEESCESCKGKGALLAIPDIAKGRPTSGTIVSRGPEARFYELGTRVAYTSYTGHLIPFRDNYRLRVMRQTEPMCVLRQRESTETQDVDALSFIDTDTPYEMR